MQGLVLSIQAKQEFSIKYLSPSVHSNIYNSSKKGNNPKEHQLWMEKLNTVHPYNGILFSHKKEWTPDPCYDVDNFKDNIMSKRSQTQKTTQYMNLFMWNVQNRQIYKDKVCWWGKERMGVAALGSIAGGQSLWWGGWKYFRLDCSTIGTILWMCWNTLNCIFFMSELYGTWIRSQ